MAARAISFDYIMYVPTSYHLRGGLMHFTSGKRTAIWNPLVDDAHLLQLAVASPSVNLQDIIKAAAEIDGDNAARCAYVRETYVRAVTKSVAAMAETIADTDDTMPTP
jgi:hypothetical protein